MCWFCTGHRVIFFFSPPPVFFLQPAWFRCVCVCVFLCFWMACLCVSHYFPTFWRRVSHRPPTTSLSLLSFSYFPLSPSLSLSLFSIHLPSFLSLSPLASAPVLSTPAPAAPISAQRCWLKPMLHLACPLRPWGHTWRAKARRAPAQARLPWPGGAPSRRISGELWTGGRPARVLSQ